VFTNPQASSALQAFPRLFSSVVARHGVAVVDSSPRASVSAARETIWEDSRAVKSPKALGPVSRRRKGLPRELRVSGFLQRLATGAIAVSVLIVALAAVALASVPTALAFSSGPQWTVTSVSRPTNFVPGDESGENAYVVIVTNTGGASSYGSPITITDELPEGLSPDPAGAFGEDRLAATHKVPGAKLKCVLLTCTYMGTVIPGDTLVLAFPVDVSAGAPPSVTNVVRVAGGGALDAAMTTPTTISSTVASFGISPGGATTALSTTQAGAHPDITTSIAFNTVNRKGALAGDPKDTIDDLPPGFAGDLIDTPSCSAARFSLQECPIDTQVGVTTLTLNLFGGTAVTDTAPVYNLSPNPGGAAKLGFVAEVGIQGALSVRPTDYGLRVTFYNTNEFPVEVDNVSLTTWGVPADPVHDPVRWNPTANNGLGGFGVSSQARPAAFSTNPTSCGSEALNAMFSVTSWEQQEAKAEMPLGPLVGCDRLTMEPALTAETSTTRAYAPTGLKLNMDIPQTYDNAYGLATANLKRAIVTLPEGMTVNPSAGAGLEACTEAQYKEEDVQFAPDKGCPKDSKLGSVKSESPAVKGELTGSVFLAQPAPNGEPGRNPFNSLLALYIVARIPDRGVLVKVPGEVRADPFTGRLVTTFDDLPPLPFSTFTFKFRQGATSPLVTPSVCGSNYTVEAQLTPWSDPSEILTPPIPPFEITQGFDGGSCPSGGVSPFAPKVLAGTQNNRAGSYSPMYIRVVRGDGEQEVTRFSSQLPPGLTANLSDVPFCPDSSIDLAKTKTGAQEESEPSCPSASQIGHTLVGAGVGSVLAQAPGKVYMAGPYNGAPFSIVAITSAKVGPFDLGTVVVRVALNINPTTAVVTVDAKVSDPIPHIIKGIVIHVRDIRVYIDRPNFSLNPTSCSPMTFSATVSGSGANFTSSTDDVPVTVGDPFQAADCASLKFKPAFKVSTSGKTSRAKGASLTVKLTYPNAPQGTQTNIRSVKVDLPKQLPSELRTLQKACPDSTFNTNPAACPATSRVGRAKAITPILPVPLTGPAYFVSHGGAKFPELIIVLQGYGVTIELHGETFIQRSGITSSTFRTIPDQPVTSFELTLPQGPYSALAANGNLCKSKLAMPTAFTAQNGLVIHQSTKIAVTGCPKAVRHARKKNSWKK
jgi:hypothetical protein